MNDVRFRDLRLHQHGAEIGQGQNIRRLLGGNHRLPLQGGDLRHFSGHRRQNFGVVEVGFGRIQGRLIAFDLGFNRADLRLFDR